MIDTAVWMYLDDRRTALRRERAVACDHWRPLIDAALAELDAMERWADRHDDVVEAAELARIAEQIRWRWGTGAASAAPGPVTPTQHGPRPLPPTDAAGVAGPGAAGAARADRTFSLPPSPTSEGGANAAPPELWVGGSKPTATNRHQGGRGNDSRVGDPRPSVHRRQSRA